MLVLPLIAYSQFGNGRTDVQVSSMGGFFMQTEAVGSNSDIKVEYIGGDLEEAFETILIQNELGNLILYSDSRDGRTLLRPYRQAFSTIG